MRLKRRSWVLAAQHHAEATSASMVMCTEYGEGMLAKHSALVAMQHEAWMPLCGGAGAVMGCVSACLALGFMQMHFALRKLWLRLGLHVRAACSLHPYSMPWLICHIIIWRTKIFAQ